MWREQMNDRNGWCDKGTKTSTKTAVLKLDMLMWDRKGISLSRKVVLLYYLGPSMAVASEGLKVMPLGISDSAMWFLSPTWNSRPLPQRRCFQDLWGLLFSSWDSMTFDETTGCWRPQHDLCQVRIQEDTVIVYLNDACELFLQAGLVWLCFFPLRVHSGPPQSWMNHMKLLSTSCQASQKKKWS